MHWPRRSFSGITGAAILILVLTGVALTAAMNDGPRNVFAAGTSSGAGKSSGSDGYSMMGPGYGMMGGGSQPSRSGSGAGTGKTQGSQALTLIVRSDAEHARRGPDGAWHDAFLPADFTVHARRRVTITVYNYDDMPHSFTSSALAVNATIPAGAADTPSKTTFSFVAPATAGSYQWWCALPCDSWAMANNGYMRGLVTVQA
jgi:hypothetical protein